MVRVPVRARVKDDPLWLRKPTAEINAVAGLIAAFGHRARCCSLPCSGRTR